MVSKKDEKHLLEAGALLDGRWEIVAHLATGGKGEVYLARQVNLDREVAVKIISPEFMELVGEDEEEFDLEMQRFGREVRAMAQVRHPNVVQVYDHGRAVLEPGDEDAVEYIAMEYVPAATLRDRTPQKGFGDDEEGLKRWIRTYFLPMIDGVDAIHSLGIVHRDLKPENVLLDGETPKITDFGLAGGPRWADQQKLTMSYHFMGTIPYMSSEHMMDMDKMDHRGDIYALGKILYEAIIGKMGKDNTFPFQSVGLPKPDTRFLKRIDGIIRKATAKDREQRISSTGELRDALLEALAAEEPGEPARAFPTRTVLLGLAVVVAVSIGAHVLYHSLIKPRPAPTVQPALKVPEKVVPVLPETLKGADGATLRLIPGGKASVPGQREKVDVEPFYLDETEVTNHQYVTFLNRVSSLVRVEGATVTGNGKVWLYLGRVSEGVEPIVFRDGRFEIENPAFHSHAVVRITGPGAAAFAGFFGRRLPTEAELALAAGEVPKGVQTEVGMHSMHTPLLKPRAPMGPVVLGEPNEYRVRGVLENVDEWVVRSGPSGAGGPRYALFGRGDGGAPYRILDRPAFEASLNVGFRCAKSPENSAAAPR